MNLAVIPARGGSKRIPRKNIREFCGKPIIAWSIEAARESGCFDTVIISTDDEEIAEVARRAGAAVPFMRPAALSDDQTGTDSVVRHAIEWSASHGHSPGHVCCIYATAPFVTAVDLRDGLSVLKAHGAQYAFAVTRFGFPIQRALRINGNGRIEMFQPEHAGTRSQDLESAFHDAGQFYWGTAAAWLAGTEVFSDAAVPIVLAGERVQDIDTPDDWDRAEALFRARKPAVA